MRVKMLKGSHRPDRNIPAGAVVDLEIKEARRLIDLRLAVPADDEDQGTFRRSAKKATSRRGRRAQARNAEPTPVSGETEPEQDEPEQDETQAD